MPPANGNTAELVAFLKRRSAHPEAPRQVEVIETHFAWVFLTETHVRKLKKPVRNEVFDLSTRALRLAACRREFAINRALGGEVYEAVEPITRNPDGDLAIGGSGEMVDAVLRMRRLPAGRALDRPVQPSAYGRLAAAGQLLAGFYRTASLPPSALGDRPAAILAQLDTLRHRLEEGPLALDAAVLAGLQAYAAGEAVRFTARSEAAFVVDGHGDLRPEHVYLTTPPHVLDRLEFDPALRQMDWQEDVALLAVDLEWQGRGWIGNALERSIAQQLGDDAPPALWAFHKAWRACLRARLCADHRLRPGRFDAGFWVRRGRAYMDLARRHARSLDHGPKGHGC
ncbi:MAG: hypothetical protein EA356_05290 [Geminicoccaceae bacterium]|nr:MAG: hypothetical protein EA356_05290 [Geminicoccaceae bacterium]